MECIILAGGQGTRLQGVIGEYPKCMAPVNEQPFLHYLFEYLSEQKCTRVVISLGYKHEIVTAWLATQSLPFEIDYVVETQPLGTGGGMALALSNAKEEDVVVLNGDTVFQVDLKALINFHKERNAVTTLALKHMQHFERYGVVNIDEQNIITAFEEKRYRDEGLINGGVYAIDKKSFFDRQHSEKFSFEKEYLEKFVGEKQFFGYESNGYFMDIGIPEDYSQVQHDFKTLFR